MIKRVKAITDRITLSCLGVVLHLRIDNDNEFKNGRVFLQVYYDAPCTKKGEFERWSGRKWYLSKHMIDDEIVKTAYAAAAATYVAAYAAYAKTSTKDFNFILLTFLKEFVKNN